jgi:hypothetical protein
MNEWRLKAGAGSSQIVFPMEMLPTDGFNGIHDNPYIRYLFWSVENVLRSLLRSLSA